MKTFLWKRKWISDSINNAIYKFPYAIYKFSYAINKFPYAIYNFLFANYKFSYVNYKFSYANYKLQLQFLYAIYKFPYAIFVYQISVCNLQIFVSLLFSWKITTLIIVNPLLLQPAVLIKPKPNYWRNIKQLYTKQENSCQKVDK